LTFAIAANLENEHIVPNRCTNVSFITRQIPFGRFRLAT
jgi:hypothetical protein